MAKTTFVPSLHGFHFPNAFTNFLVNTPFGPITTGGRCGGMAYAALDYYSRNLPVPNCYDSNLANIHDFSASGKVPPDGTVLADYIMFRLMATFVRYGCTAAMWSSASDHSTGLGPGRVPATKNNEWPKLKAWLDNGVPVTIGMVSSMNDLTAAHQVVAYDYSLGTDAQGNPQISISIYDDNFPDDDTITLTSTVDLWTTRYWNEVSTDPTTRNLEQWAGWWVEDGTPASWWGVAGWMVGPTAGALAAAIVALYGVSAFVALPGFVSPASSEQELIGELSSR